MNKRFKMEYVHGNPTIWHITDCGEHIVDEKICDLLNALHEENEQLKKDCTALIYHNQEYRKENEQLKKVVGLLKNDNVNDIVDVLNLQETTIWELKQENEQLNQFKNKVFKLLRHNIQESKEWRKLNLYGSEKSRLQFLESVLTGIEKELRMND